MKIAIRLGSRTLSCFRGAATHSFAAVCLLTVVAGCGGGGGGGMSNETGIRILHAAIDASPVDIILAGAPGVVIQRGAFGLASEYAGLDSGPQTIQLTLAKNPTVKIASFVKTVAESQRFSLLLFGDNANLGLRTHLIDDSIPDNSGSGALIRVIDAVTGAASVNVSVTAGARQTFSVDFGNASPYTRVTSGAVHISVLRAVDSRSVASADVFLAEGRAYTFLIAGEQEYFVKSHLLLDK